MSHIEPKWELQRKYDVRLNKYVVTLVVYTIDRHDPTNLVPIMTDTRYVPVENYEKFIDTIAQLNAIKDEKLRQLHILFDEIPS